MNSDRLFDVEVLRSVETARLGWPTRLLSEGARLGGNQEYVDLTDLSWADATDLAEEERQILDRIRLAADPDVERETVEEELEEDPGLLVLLDPGVASTVAALAAAGCVPFASCNGGALGDYHHEQHPLVVFYARAAHVPLLMAAAEETQVGLENDIDGGLIVYSNRLDRMPAFALALLSRRAAFDELTMVGRGDGEVSGANAS